MLEIIFSIFYVFLFAISFYKKKYVLFILPIFVFCYPNKLSFINIGDGFGLDDIFILFHFGLAIVSRKPKFSHIIEIRHWRLLNLMIFLTYVVTNLVGYGADSFSNFVLMDFVKSALLFAYTYFICIIYCSSINRQEQIRSGKIALIIATVFQSIIAILVYHYTSSFSFFYDSTEVLLSGDVAFRAVGSLKGPWELGGFLAIGYVLIYTELVFGRKSSRLLTIMLVFGLLFTIYALVISTSRASWLFVLASTIVLFFKKPSKQLFYSFILVIVSFLLFQNYLDRVGELIMHRFLQTTASNNGALDNSSEERFIIWNKLYNNYDFTYALFGYGWQNFIRVFKTTPHNGFLSCFLAGGIIGTFVYFKFFYFIWKNQVVKVTRKFSNVNFGIPAIMAGLFVFSITTDTLFTNSVFKMLTIVGTLSVHDYVFKLSAGMNLVEPERNI
ncbi:hypothetical protein N180_15345 [Pedobacter antarcticus 4BY]|uniref:O-antigen ligase-related domain-containing protein n=2 Tax=Pedobacter antarcticus TaxID=34086 RepID=A0A081PDZ9_9SPHI|nr:O-antigen ligase family protein [Pedobacter antarcticus]KEQ28922.1 hypothetical protein N180_15345 [Pedobacter antarcticus 4BY]SFF12975.1 O-antigen ligase like membrane protein [Pedobacter antarcticus]